MIYLNACGKKISKREWARACVEDILRTKKGTRELNRDYGISVDVLDSPIDTGMLSYELTSQVVEYYPELSVDRIEVWEDKGRVVFNVELGGG